MFSLIKQKTIRKEVSFQGFALHTGIKSKLKLIPMGNNKGIVFVRKDLKKKNIIKANWNNVSNTKLCTTISNQFGVTVSTIEHLMSAISALQIDNLKIEISGPEVPILDGSSKIYFKKISDIGIVSQEKNKQFIKILKKVSVKNGTSEASLSPSKNRVSNMVLIIVIPFFTVLYLLRHDYESSFRVALRQGGGMNYLETTKKPF